MKAIELSAASKPLSYASKLRGGVVILTDRRRPVAALVSLRGVDREALSVSRDSEFQAIIRQARRDIAAGRTLSLEEVRRAVRPGRRRAKRAS